ncbi:MAG: DNA mismatch repair endonuclease MutL, partial [Myxococcota bacterium]
FVNGRYVSDSTIRAAIRGAYGTLMEKGRHPSVVLFLEVPHDMVDINVHPAKIEVRFHDTNAIYRAVYHAIADELAEAPWVKREVRAYKLQPYAERAGVEGASQAGGARHVEPQMARLEPVGVKQRRLSELEHSKLKASRIDYRDAQQPYYAQGAPAAPEPRQQGFSARGAQPLAEPDVLRADPEALGAGRQMDEAAGEAANTAREGQGGYFSALRVIGQFKRQYIVCEDASGLVVIDQHAAHERIGFERLKKIFATEHKETQPLLFPKRLELSALRAEVLAEHMEFFTQAGFEIEHFGGQTYVLKAVPAIFQKANIDKIVRDAIDDIAQSGRSSRLDEAMEAVLSRMACHSVVRGPTSLTDEECYALLEQMDQIDFAANCPHGRPVYFRMSLHEIEESFDRR